MKRLLPAVLGFALTAPMLAGTAGEIFGSVSDPDFRELKRPLPRPGPSAGARTRPTRCVSGSVSFTLDAENLASSRTVSPDRATELAAVEPFLRDLWSQLDAPRR